MIEIANTYYDSKFVLCLETLAHCYETNWQFHTNSLEAELITLLNIDSHSREKVSNVRIKILAKFVIETIFDT